MVQILNCILILLNTSLGCEDNLGFFKLFLKYKIWLTSERDFDYADISPLAYGFSTLIVANF